MLQKKSVRFSPANTKFLPEAVDSGGILRLKSRVFLPTLPTSRRQNVPRAWHRHGARHPRIGRLCSELIHEPFSVSPSVSAEPFRYALLRTTTIIRTTYRVHMYAFLSNGKCGIVRCRIVQLKWMISDYIKPVGTATFRGLSALMLLPVFGPPTH
jgi:hypothetical protein